MHFYITMKGNTTADLPRHDKRYCQNRVKADRPRGSKVLKKGMIMMCALAESKHQKNIDPNNPQFGKLGRDEGCYWTCWCRHLRVEIPCRGHMAEIARAARKV